MKEITQQGEISYNLTDASVSDLSSWLQEVGSATHKTGDLGRQRLVTKRNPEVVCCTPILLKVDLQAFV